MKIKSLHAREILDSRGNPTVEVDVTLENGILGRAAVPSGASTGTHEAHELRDGDNDRYGGKGVTKAVANVNGEIADAVVGMDATDQRALDEHLIKLDDTKNKEHLGANAILGVSLAVAHAVAKAQDKPLFEYVHSMSKSQRDPMLPLPMCNIVNGGEHGNWATDIQEFMIMPVGASNFTQALQMQAEVFHALKKVLKEKGYPVTVGDEGGYAPPVKEGNKEALELITQAVGQAGYEMGKDIVLALDVAASEFYKDGKYNLACEDKQLTSDEMVAWLQDLKTQYPIHSIEDGLDQEDWQGWTKLNQTIGSDTQLVGDDLLVTNVEFLKNAIDEKAANAILIKVNQIGTLTETIDAVDMAHDAGWKAIISHRSGETEDTTIAHLAVGLGTGQIKTGSMSRSERIAKYNELLRINELLGNGAIFAGKDTLK